MTRIANFVALFGGRFTLPNDDDGINGDFTFMLPDDTAIGNANQNRGVLSYVVRPLSSNPSNLRYTITINGTEVANDATLVDTERRAIQEVLDGVLRRGENTIVFERTSGDTRVQFSDTVIWFQRDV
ncbi:MAG: hypothetical protein ACRDRX_04605 [Pseudonocardiaceae bacterium]